MSAALAHASDAQSWGAGAGIAVAALAAVLFAVGATLQHHAAAASKTAGSLDLRRLVRRPAWAAGQATTALGTAVQVVALALAPVAVVQPMLAGALVVALGIRAVRRRCIPPALELLGAALTVGGLATFLVSAQPRPGSPHHVPGLLPVLAAVLVAVGFVALATRFDHGPAGALACGCAGGIAAGIGAVLISVGIRDLADGGLLHTLAGAALWGAVAVAVVAQLGGQQAYARGSLAWSLPALTLCDPLAAVPAARWLLGERLQPGHAVIWLPAAVVAAAGVILLARTGEGCRRPFGRRRAEAQPPVRTPAAARR